MKDKIMNCIIPIAIRYYFSKKKEIIFEDFNSNVNEMFDIIINSKIFSFLIDNFYTKKESVINNKYYELCGTCYCDFKFDNTLNKLVEYNIFTMDECIEFCKLVALVDKLVFKTDSYVF